MPVTIYNGETSTGLLLKNGDLLISKGGLAQLTVGNLNLTIKDGNTQVTFTGLCKNLKYASDSYLLTLKNNQLQLTIKAV